MNSENMNRGLVFLLAFITTSFSLDRNLDHHWENFKRVFKKEYLYGEEIIRRIIWEGNVAFINAHNLEYDLEIKSYLTGLNEYSDMAHDEFLSVMVNQARYKNDVKPATNFVPLSHMKLPSHVDWRKNGYVTGVRNQGQCGSIWAISATGSLEGQHKKKTGNLVPLSAQNLVDCINNNTGCTGGGSVDEAFEYVIKNGGIDTEECYPSGEMAGVCKFNKSCIGATCFGYVDIESGNEYALQQAVATVGPISAYIDASSMGFQMYTSGVYDDPNCSSTQLDHAILIVGYGTESGKDYWIVKNSWGTSWGLKGYILMSRNKNNQCGIATLASYPLE